MPLVTRILLLLNVGIHICLSLLGFSDEARVSSIYENFGLMPIRFLEGAFWQPFTSIFLHAPYIPLHLIVNMIGVWSFGSLLERQIGSLRFLWLYLVSALFGSLLVIFIPYFMGSYAALARPTVGASGALLGLLGGVAVLYPRSRLFILFFPMQARWAALLLGVGSFLLSIVDTGSFISHHGHLGGLIGGILYAKLALLPELRKNTSDFNRSVDTTYKLKRSKPMAGVPWLSALGRKLKKRSNTASTHVEVHISQDDPADLPIQEKIINPLKTKEVPGQKEQKGHEEENKEGRLIYDPWKDKFYYK